MSPRNTTTPPPASPVMVLDAELVRLVGERRAALSALKEVLRRVGPSTPKRNDVNRDRAERRRVHRETVAMLEAQIVARIDQLVPHTYPTDE